MSGRKYSRVELARNVREAISCRAAAEGAYATALNFVAALEATSLILPALKPAAAAARVTLEQIREQLEEIKKSFAESDLMRLTLGQVLTQRGRVEALRAQLEKIARDSRRSSEAAKLLTELNVVLSALRTDRDELEPLLSDTYDRFYEETCLLADDSQRELEQTGNLGRLADQIVERAEQYRGMLETASARRTADAERRYVAGALQRVCVREMGFAARVLPQGTLLDDLILEVDTFSYGLIHFRLQLDGMIRSASEMVETSCFANYTVLEDGLRSLGVGSNFLYESDRRPVVHRKGEKALPGSEPATAAGERQQ